MMKLLFLIMTAEIPKPDSVLIPPELRQYRQDPILDSFINLFYEEEVSGMSFRSALQTYIGEEKHEGNQEKYWYICADTAICMSRIVNHDKGIDISQEPSPIRPQLQLVIALYENGTKTDDHTYIRYYTGKVDESGHEVVYSVDPNYQASFGGRGVQGDLTIRRHTTATIDENLAKEFHLHPPERNLKYFEEGNFVESKKDTIISKLAKHLAIFNGDEIINANSRRTLDGSVPFYQWTNRMVDFIKMCRPEWTRIKKPPANRIFRR